MRPAARDEIGAHVSIAGGLHLALERGRALGCGAVQIFLKNQRQWAARPLGADEVRAFRGARRAAGIAPVFAHASYLINLASPGAAAWRQAVDAFTDELERAEALGLLCVVIHPGSHLGTGPAAGLERIAVAVREALGRTRGYRVRIALENTAGAGGVLGRTFAELGALLDRAGRPRRLGVCLDTCHLFAGGYDVRAPAGYAEAMNECVRVVGVERVAQEVAEVLRRTRGYRVRVALENTAGAGGSVGRTFAELGALVTRLGGARRVGVCLDTCHLFAAGYDIRSPAGYETAVAECAREVGITRVLAFHLNDARAPLGSGLDRHEHIGRGYLGLPAFRLLLNDPRFTDVPKVLETPKDPEPAADLRNLATLRRLRRVSGSSSRPPAGTAR